MTSEKISYVFSRIAENDLDGILEYIINVLHNSEAASAFLTDLEHKISDICTFPESGEIVNNEYLLRSDIHKFLVRNYIAYYFYDKKMERIVILRIIYGKRDQNIIFQNM